jgi:hypothetical protein
MVLRLATSVLLVLEIGKIQVIFRLDTSLNIVGGVPSQCHSENRQKRGFIIGRRRAGALSVVSTGKARNLLF